MRYILYFLIWLFCSTHVLGQHPSSLCERIYLQTDKQLYLAGETLWLKVLTVTPERIPLLFSKIAYVELLDETTPHQQVKIKIVDGVGEGWMKLPKNLLTGCYRLIAYTRFMRNESPDVLFEKNIGIVNTYQSVPSENMQKKAIFAPGEPTRNTVNLSANKPVYATREKGLIQLDNLPADIYTLSISIAGKSLITIDGDNNILQWGEKIAKPASNFSGKFIPEYESHIVTGKLVSLDDSEIPVGFNAFLSIPGEQPQVFVGKRNQFMVSFYLTDIYGTAEVATMANTASENCRIDLQSPFIQHHVTKQLPLFTIDSTHLDDLLKRSVALQVSSPFSTESLTTDAGNVYPKIEYYKVYLLDEYTRFPKMDELIIEFVQGVRFRMNNNGKRELAMAVKRGNEVLWITPLVFMDGIPIKNHDLIFHYNPLLVEKIGVCLKEYLLGGVKYDGILTFSTYKHHYPDLVLDKTYQIVDFTGIQPHHSLFVPKYPDVTMHRKPDFRHTLLWTPDVRAFGESSFQIPFYTSDYRGEFLVTVEGLTQSGNPVYATTVFNVQ